MLNKCESAEAILQKHQNIVAVKYHLGTKLVIGHKPTYYNEASIAAMKEYAILYSNTIKS